MIIGGLQKNTLIDYPGKIACTVFLAGCNLRCPWCYSSELVLPEKIEKQPKISQEELFGFLKERKGLLDGVVICGGEPTINEDLPSFLKKIKDMSFSVKLDTNGSNSKKIKDLIDKGLIDYVAMDVKLPKEKYKDILDIDPERIEKSISLLKEGKVDYEFRTTVVPGVLKKEDVVKIAEWIRGAKKYYLQSFRAEKTIDPQFEKIELYSDEYLKNIVDTVCPLFEFCQLRD